MDIDGDKYYCARDKILIKFSQPIKISNITEINLTLDGQSVKDKLNGTMTALSNNDNSFGTAYNDTIYADTFQILIGPGGVNDYYYGIGGKNISILKENVINSQNQEAANNVEVTLPNEPVRF